MNKVILMGRLTRDPEVRYSKAAEPLAIAKYSLAVRRQFSKEGQPDVDFVNIIAFGRAGEFAEKYFKKGQQVCVVGRLQMGSYDDKDGNKRYTTDVIVEEQHFAESKRSFEENQAQSNNSATSHPQTQAPKQRADGFVPVNINDNSDDLPF